MSWPGGGKMFEWEAKGIDSDQWRCDSTDLHECFSNGLGDAAKGGGAPGLKNGMAVGIFRAQVLMHERTRRRWGQRVADLAGISTLEIPPDRRPELLGCTGLDVWPPLEAGFGAHFALLLFDPPKDRADDREERTGSTYLRGPRL